MIDNSFKEYLEKSSKNDGKSLEDFSKLSLSELLKKRVDIKRKISPNYGKNFRVIFNFISEVEKESGITIKPIQITDVFWTGFIRYAVDKKYAHYLQ